MKELFSTAQIVREQVIEQFPLSESDQYYPLSVVYLWPTKYCPIGCDHCLFASPDLNEVDPDMILSDEEIGKFIEFSRDGNLDTLVVSGGGEPMLELPKVQRLIREAHYKQFEVITGAYWTSSRQKTVNTLLQLQEAISDRKSHEDRISFSLRVSVDKHHQTVVKLEWLKNLVDVLLEDTHKTSSERLFPDINLYFRTLIDDDDTTVTELAQVLEAEIGPIENYMQYLTFRDKNGQTTDKIGVFYKDMRYLGRALGKRPEKDNHFDDYFASYADVNDDIRLGMVYINPGSTGQALEGINVTISYDGKMMPYGGVGDVAGNLLRDNYQVFTHRLFKDVVSKALLKKGVNYVKKIAEEVDPDIDRRIKDKSWIASVADESLSTSPIRLYTTIRIMQEMVRTGEISIDQISAGILGLINTSKNELQKGYYEYLSEAPSITHHYSNEMVYASDTKA